MNPLFVKLTQLIYNVDFIAWLEPIIGFFRSFGEIGLFLYAIIETITPLAGIEFFLVPMIMSSPARWIIISLLIIVANVIGAAIIYLFLAKEDNRLYRKFVSPKNQDKAKTMFKRYGFWAIFIFAMTPLPFFVIIFTAAIGRMKFLYYITSVAVSRGFRFIATAYFIHSAVVTGNSIDTSWIILWLTLIGVGFTVVMVIIQQHILMYVERNMSKES